MNEAVVPRRRRAIIEESHAVGDHAEFWRVSYYGASVALATGRADQLLTALTEVLADPADP
jgi:hypothetical protein